MTDFRERYKRVGYGRENALVNRALRSQQRNDDRRKRRSQLFGLSRDQEQNHCSDKLEEVSKGDAASTLKHPDKELTDYIRRQRQMWRNKKFQRKLLEERLTRPPFVVGIVRHPVYSTPTNKDPSPPIRLCKRKENVKQDILTGIKRVSKATENRRAMKAVMENKENKNTQKPKIRKETKNEVIVEKMPLASTDHQFKAPEGIDEIPLFGRRAMEAAREKSLSFINSSSISFVESLIPKNTSTPIQPSIRLSLMTSNDEGNACKELEGPINSPLRTEKECVEKDLCKPKTTAEKYKYSLNQETARLNELCDSWEAVKDDETTPEDFHFWILAAIGQTQLLLNKKFKRFQSLVQDCETGEGELPVTCEDLQGFWELIGIEIADCKTRFQELEKLKANGWMDEEKPKVDEKLKKKSVIKRPAVAEKKVAAVRSSSLKAFIDAARKQILQNKSEHVNKQPVPVITVQKAADDLKVPASEDKDKNKIPTIPKIQISQATMPMNKSVLRKVHLSQDRKSAKSTLISLQISQLCKMPQVQLESSVDGIDSDPTPVVCILKSTESEKSDGISVSQRRRVKNALLEEDFAENELIDRNSKSLTIVEEEKRPIKRRLSFRDEDSGIASSFKDDSKENVRSEYLLRNKFYITSEGTVLDRSLSPAKEETCIPSELKRSHLKISPRRGDESKIEPLTPKQRSCRIQKLTDSKK